MAEFELREANYTSLYNHLRKWGKVTSFEASAWRMYNGDHWDNGRGYIGPAPLTDDPEYDRILSLITQAFTSRNVVSECVNRAIDGLLSRSPSWTLYNQATLVSRAISDATRRNELRERARILMDSILGMLDLENPQLPTPDSVRQLPSITATNNNGSIDIENGNNQDNEDGTETVNTKEVEAEILLTEMYSKLNLKKVFKEVLAERLVTGRGCLRVYIPKKYIDGSGEINGLLDAVKALRVERVDRANAKVIDDEGDRLSVVKLEKSKPESGKIQKLKGIELSFVDDKDGNTYVAVFEPSNQTKSNKLTKPDGAESSVLNPENIDDVSEVIQRLQKSADLSEGMFLDGNLMTHEISGQPFVTEQLLQNNRALNLDLTLGINVLIESGFTEMVTMNAQLETEEIPDPNNPGKTIKRAKALKRGSQYATNIVGVQTYDEKGMKQFANTGVEFRQPTPLTAFRDGENLYYRQCLSETKQNFVLINDATVVSGESRVQSRQDFLNVEKDFKPEFDEFAGSVCATLLHLAAWLVNQNGYFKGIGIAFDCKISAGDLSADEKNVVITQYEKGLKSREDAMVLLGTEDPIIEIDKIRADEAERMLQQILRMMATSRFADQIQQDKEVNGDPDDPETRPGNPTKPPKKSGNKRR